MTETAPTEEKAPEETVEKVPELSEINVEQTLPENKFIQIILIRETKKYAHVSKNLYEYSLDQKKDDIFFIVKSELIQFISKDENQLVADIVKPYLLELREKFLKYQEKNERIPLDDLAKAIKIKVLDLILLEKTIEEDLKRRQLEEERKKLAEEEALKRVQTADAKDKKGKKGKKDGKGKKDKGKKGKDKKDKGKKDKGKKDKSSKADTKKGKDKKDKKGKGKKGGKEKEAEGDGDEEKLKEKIEEPPVPTFLHFYVLFGFNDVNILTDLQKMNVDVSAIIDFSPRCCLSERPIDIDNTIIINYVPRTDSIKTNFEDFKNLIKLSPLVKREHLNYLKEMLLYQFEATPSPVDVKGFKYYNKLLEYYPTDTITIPLILDSLIEEIVARFEDLEYDPSIVSLLNIIPNNPKSCTCPPKRAKTDILTKTFKVHEEDLLSMIVNTYKGIGKPIHDKTLEYFEKSKVLSQIQPKTLNKVTKKNKIIPPDEEDEEKDTGPLFEYLNSVFLKDWLGVNPYQWREDLNLTTLFQLVIKAEGDYSSFDLNYYEDTDTYFLRFYDSYDSCGICSTIWEQDLKTPLCLKDYFLYIFDINALPKEGNEEKPEETQPANNDVLEAKSDTEVAPPDEVPPIKSPSVTVKSSNKKPDKLKYLLNYPKHGEVKKLCISENGTFKRVGYDLGWDRIQLTGNTTIFESYDGVKITLDTTKFLDEKSNFFRISIKFNDDCLIFDSRNVNPLNFYFLLADGTKIYFEQPLKEEGKAKDLVSLAKPVKEDPEEKPEDRKVITTNWMKFEDYIGEENFETEILKEEFLEDLKGTLNVNANALLKVNEGLKKSTSERPLSTILSRILPSDPSQFILKDFDIVPKEPNLKSFNFRIILPTEGTITAFFLKNDVINVKNDNGTDNFRIFTSNGEIIAKHPNGAVKIYRPNGDLILLENPLNQPPTCPIHCDCDNVETFQAILKKMFGSSDYKPSRGAPPLNEKDDLGEFTNAPFRKKTLLKFNGLSVIWENGELKYNQTNFVLMDNDFLKGEKYYERDDNFKCCLTKDSQNILFPDGTQIITNYDFEEYLLVFNKEDTEGWVVVLLKYNLTTPKFGKTTFDPCKKSAEIYLNRGSIKVFPDFYQIHFPNTEVFLRKDTMKIRKGCNNCYGKFVSILNINPFYEDLKIKQGVFLEAKDSYNKKFTVDFKGNWENYFGFDPGAINKFDCNHYKNRDVQKVFLLKKNEKEFSGCLLWTEAMIDNWKRMNKENVSIKDYYSNLCKRDVLELYRNYYTNFQFWYLPSWPKLDISRNNETPEENPQFVTYRILKRIPGFQNVKKSYTRYIENAVDVPEAIQVHYSKKKEEEKEEEEKLKKEIEEEEKKQSDEQKAPEPFEVPKIDFNVNDVLKIWKGKCDEVKTMIKQRQFNPYFRSEYNKMV